MEAMTVRIDFKSGFSIGNGYGLAGAIDSMVERDAMGLPFIPGKSLKGILRDACEDLFLVSGGILYDTPAAELKAALDAASNVDPRALSPITRIFGSVYQESAFEFKSASLRIHRKDLSGFVRLHSAWIESHNSIHPHTGTALEEHLYSQEVVIIDGDVADAFFEFDIQPLQNDIPDELIGLLVCGVRFTERIGAKKRRGKGVMEMNLTKNFRGRGMEEWVNLALERNEVIP